MSGERPRRSLLLLPARGKISGGTRRSDRHSAEYARKRKDAAIKCLYCFITTTYAVICLETDTACGRVKKVKKHYAAAGAMLTHGIRNTGTNWRVVKMS
jgi:hypothetical protein